MFVRANLAQLVVIWDWMVYAQVIPPMMRDLHLSYWQAGLPVTVLLSIMAVMQFVGGMLADRLPEPLLSVAALVAALVGSAVAWRAASLAALVWSRGLVGAGAGLSFIAGMRLAVRLYRGQQLSLAMGVFGSMVSMGILLSAAATPALEGLLGWRGVYALSASLTAALTLAYVVFDRRGLLPAMDPWPRQRGRVFSSLLEDARRLGDPTTWVAGFYHTASFGILLGLSSWLPALLTEAAGLGAQTAGRIMAAFAAVSVVGRMTGPAGSSLVGDRLHVGLSLLGLALSLEGLALVAGRASIWWLLVLVMTSGWLANHPFSTVMAGAAARDPEHAGAVLGALNVVALGMSMTLPVGFGWLKDMTNSFQASLVFFAAVAALGAGLSRFLSRGVRPAEVPVP